MDSGSWAGMTGFFYFSVIPASEPESIEKLLVWRTVATISMAKDCS
jgi:hypothetical protein